MKARSLAHLSCFFLPSLLYLVLIGLPCFARDLTPKSSVSHPTGREGIASHQSQITEIEQVPLRSDEAAGIAAGASQDQAIVAQPAMPVLRLSNGWSLNKALSTPDWITLSSSFLSQNNGTLSGLAPQQFTSSNLVNLGFRIGPITGQKDQAKPSETAPREGISYHSSFYRRFAINGLLTQRFGQILSTYIPNQLNTQWNFGNGPVGRLGYLNLEYKSEQDFVSMVKVGKLMQAQDFTMNPVMCYFSNFGFCGWAQGIPAMISIPGNPFNSYGAVVAFGNEQNVSVRYGLYQIAPSTFAPDLHGLDFSFNKGIGIAQFVEARIPVKISSLLPVKLNPKTNTVSLAAPEDASMLYQSLLPQGTITLGGWLGSGAYQTVSNPEETQPQNNGAYGIASFKIPSLDVGLDHRIFISGGVGFTPDVQQFRSGGNAGVVIAGLIPKRPFDTLSLGASYANYNSNYYLAGAESNTYSPNTEFGLELNYSMNLSQSLRIMPNLQIIINPAGNSAQSTVLVGGIQAWLFF